jgi:hypothetical protein
MRASWKNHQTPDAQPLERGQLATTERELSKEWGKSRSWVRMVLKRLQNDTMIDTTKGPAGIIITITNYDSYQGDDVEKNQKRTEKEPEKDQRETTTPSNRDQRETTLHLCKKGKKRKKGEEGEVPAAPAPSPGTPAPAPPAEDSDAQREEPIEALLDPEETLLFRSGDLRGAMRAAEDSRHLRVAQRLAMRIGDVSAASRIARALLNEGGGR